MKTRNILTGLIILALAFAMPLEMLAQGKAKGGPPPWAPAHGYRAQTKHIYFPEHNVYYDVQRNVYISMSNGKWQVGVSLPLPFAKVDLKNSVQVELDLNTSSPQKYNTDHVAMYKGKGKDKGKDKAKGGPPPWAPAHGYRAKTKHIYFPEHNVYYDVQRNVYISMSNGKWQVGVSLPLPFAKVDLKNSVQVELDLNTSSPQKYNADHMTMYKGKGKGGNGKAVVVKTEPVKVVKTPGPAKVKGKKK